jgi:hydroxymethylbilane synthase
MKIDPGAREITIGTRGSPLARAQAKEVADRLIAAHGEGAFTIRTRIIKTSGDMIQDRALAAAGGKGLFTKEIEEALIAREIDLAVHSMKDMPVLLPKGLSIECILPREDVRDAFISRNGETLAALARGATIGTASVRRQAAIRRYRPDFKVVLFRGNVETRLRKLREGVADATLLAAAGLKRLGLTEVVTEYLSTEIMLPAPAQGAIGVEIRSGDHWLIEALAPVNDAHTATEIEAERAFLGALDGSCRTPIAALARLDGGALSFRCMIITPDGARAYETERQGGGADAALLGLDAAQELLRRGGPDVFRAVA